MTFALTFCMYTSFLNIFVFSMKLQYQIRMQEDIIVGLFWNLICNAQIEEFQRMWLFSRPVNHIQHNSIQMLNNFWRVFELKVFDTYTGDRYWTWCAIIYLLLYTYYTYIRHYCPNILFIYFFNLIKFCQPILFSFYLNSFFKNMFLYGCLFFGWRGGGLWAFFLFTVLIKFLEEP